jgi:predicted porin
MRVTMKLAYLSTAALLAALGSAQAADLPTKKTPAAPQKPNCFASLYSYFDSSPADCPLSYWGVTFYATIDMGVGYASHGAPFNGLFPTGTTEFVNKFGNRGTWAATPNGLSQSQVGLKAKEPIYGGVSFVGEVATGFDPYSLELANGPGSQAQNTDRLLNTQSTNGDSSRAGQWDNSVAYAGLSHDTFGTLTFGRQNSFTLEGVNAYDPMGGSYAFSPIGWSGKTAGAGSTEDARVNSAIKYTVKYNMFHAGVLGQVGGFDWGNGSNGEYQINAGVEYAGLSVDAIYSQIKDQVNLSTYNNLPGAPAIAGTTTGAGPSVLTPNALKATLSNNSSVMLLAKYKWNQFTLYGGFEHIDYNNPSDKYPNGFTTIGGYTVAPGGVSSTAYTIPLHFDVFWTGIKYAVNDRIDVTGAYYLYDQHNFSAAGTDCGPNKKPALPGYAPQGSASSACQGYMNAFSAMIDWRPLKRVDVYAGLMYSKVSGGLANGYLYSDDLAPTAGVRVRF